MKITDHITKYLAESFKPIRITALRDDWRKLKYENSIFGVHVFYDKCMEEYQTRENLNKMTNLSFSACFYNYYIYTKFMMHPLTYILSLVNDQHRHDFVIDLYNEQNVSVTFDTKGMIPNRWIRMLADFGLENATIDEDSSVSQEEINKRWYDRISALPEQVIENIGHMFRMMMEQQRVSVQVVRAPPYNIGYDDPNNPDDSEYYENVHRKRPDDNSLIYDRVWGTYDAYATPSAQIFFQKCQKYHSYYCKNHQPYYTLAACEGGISLAYLQYLPWANLRPYLMDGGNGYHDIRYHNKYYPRKDTPYEELIVLAEALKKEGAEIILKIEND